MRFTHQEIRLGEQVELAVHVEANEPLAYVCSGESDTNEHTNRIGDKQRNRAERTLKE